jgi:Flp pilus assembly protein TadG
VRSLGRLPGRVRRTCLPRGRSGARGQALLELALVAPVLLLLVLAALDLGRLFYSSITVTDSARAGAMEAAQEPTSFSSGAACSPTNRVMCAATNESAGSFVTIAPADVTMSCSPSCAKGTNPANRVTVTVTGHFSLLTPLLSVFTGGPNVTLRSAATADIITIPAIAVASPPPSSSPSASPSPSPSPPPSPSPGVSPSPAPSASPAPSPSPSPACALPVANFSYYQDKQNKPVTFTSSSTPTSGPCAITYWRWEFGDGDTAAGNLPSVDHDYPNQGSSFTATLTVTGPGGVSTPRIVTVVLK